ncbi:MAG: hypothetical protein Q7R65_02445, partial [bacterium]|nr:hypothetical protein [bacterium]
MKVLSISSDRKIFEEGSAVRARTVEYANLFEELHIIIFSKRGKLKTGNLQLTANCWLYSTNSWNRWLYIFDAVRIGKIIIENCKLSRSAGSGEVGKIENSLNDFVVSSQDPFECGLTALKIARCFKLPLHVQIHTDFLSSYFVSQSFLNRIRVFIASRVLSRANAIRVVSQR